MHRTASLVTSLGLCLVLGCQTTTPKNVLYARTLKQTVEDFEAVRKETSSNFARIGDVTRQHQNDLPELAQQLKKESASAENAVRNIKSEFDRMLQAANDLFAAWEEKINELENPETKDQERERLDGRRTAYETELNANRGKILQLDDALKDLRDIVRVIEIRMGEQELKGKISELQDIASRAGDIVKLLEDLTTKGRELAATAE